MPVPAKVRALFVSARLGTKGRQDIDGEANGSQEITQDAQEQAQGQQQAQGKQAASLQVDGGNETGSALAELGVPSHEAHHAGDGANGALALVNALHARLRAFLARFAGVSTRRLQYYLDWFCYAEQYARTDVGREEVLAADQARGRYENSCRDLARTPQPFGEYWGCQQHSNREN